MTHTPHNSPRRRAGRRWSLIAAGAFLGLVLLAALVVGVGGSDTPPQARPPAPAPAPPRPDRPPQGDQGIPAYAPPVRWELVNRVAVPVSAEAGPHEIRGPVAAGYQRSPVGALVAASQISTRYLLTQGDGWKDVVEQQVLPGPGRDVYVRSRGAVTDDSTAGQQLAQIAGYRFVTYSPDTAVVQLASAAPDGALVGTTVTVRWSDGDWRLELQPNGAASPGATSLSDLTYYTPWSGVGN